MVTLSDQIMDYLDIKTATLTAAHNSLRVEVQMEYKHFISDMARFIYDDLKGAIEDELQRSAQYNLPPNAISGSVRIIFDQPFINLRQRRLHDAGERQFSPDDVMSAKQQARRRHIYTIMCEAALNRIKECPNDIQQRLMAEVSDYYSKNVYRRPGDSGGGSAGGGGASSSSDKKSKHKGH